MIILHGHCHQKAIASVEPSAAMLSLPQNYTVETLPTGCCGMAGAFGYEKEHYDVSIAVGNQTLFPLINAATSKTTTVDNASQASKEVTKASETIISAPGTSCRQQILDGTGRIAKHPVVILREALRG